MSPFNSYVIVIRCRGVVWQPGCTIPTFYGEGTGRNVLPYCFTKKNNFIFY